MQELEVPEYLTHVDKRINEENERVLHYLDTGTRYNLHIYCKKISTKYSRWLNFIFVDGP